MHEQQQIDRLMQVRALHQVSDVLTLMACARWQELASGMAGRVTSVVMPAQDKHSVFLGDHLYDLSADSRI